MQKDKYEVSDGGNNVLKYKKFVTQSSILVDSCEDQPDWNERRNEYPQENEERYYSSPPCFVGAPFSCQGFLLICPYEEGDSVYHGYYEQYSREPYYQSL